MTLPIFAAVFGGLMLGWKRRDGIRRRREPAQFLSTVSHELRTPLNAMVGWVKLLKTGRLGPGDTARALDSLDRNLLLETQLIDQLLDASCLLGGRTEIAQRPVDLRAVVNAAHDRVAAIAGKKGVAISIRSSAVPVVVRGDESRLTDVVWHLLKNAVTFSDPGSEITLVVEGLGDSASIRVADQGSGIANEFLPRVFEPFAQGQARTRRAGLGLGLAIARALVRLHRGTISAHSAGRGRGAIFRVSLPRLNARSDWLETTARKAGGHAEDPGNEVLHVRPPRPG